MDTSNFDPVEEREEDSDSENDETRNLDHPLNGKFPEHAFFEFTFKRFFDDAGHPYPTAKYSAERNERTERTEEKIKLESDSNGESNSPVYV